MLTPQKRKLFFWIFGLIFAAVVYFFLQKYTSNSLYIILSVSLVIILLFFIIGEILSHISNVYFYLLNKNSKKAIEQAKLDEKDQKIKEIVKKLKNTIKYTVSQNYSEDSIKMLNEYVGINYEDTKKLIFLTKRLTKIKWIYWLSGLFFSIANVFLIFYIDFFIFLRSPFYLPIFLNIIIFLLFYVVGILITRLPDKFYLEIINLKEEKIKKSFSKKKEIYEFKQKESIENINKIIEYLIKLKISENEIINIITQQGFSKKTAEEIVFEVSKKKVEEINVKKNSSTEKLLLSKMYEEFKKLKEINTEIATIKETLLAVEGKQKEIELNLKQFKNTKSSYDYDSENIIVEKNNKKTKTPAHEKGYVFSEEVLFLYNLISPQATKYRKKEVESFLLYQNYSLETISDLMELFKQKKINFKESQEDNKIISFINRFFEKK